MSARTLLLAALALVAFGCDDEENLVPLDWSLNRMIDQPRYDAFGDGPGFPDGKAMQAPPPGTVPRERIVEPLRLSLGLRPAGGTTEQIPIELNQGILEAGRDRFERTCAVCHGALGNGVSEVANKMQFVKPVSFHDPSVRAFTSGRIYQVATFGYGLMPSFGYILTTEERWAIVAYIRALQISQGTPLSELPPDVRQRFESEVRQ